MEGDRFIRPFIPSFSIVACQNQKWSYYLFSPFLGEFRSPVVIESHSKLGLEPKLRLSGSCLCSLSVSIAESTCGWILQPEFDLPDFSHGCFLCCLLFTFPSHLLEDSLPAELGIWCTKSWFWISLQSQNFRIPWLFCDQLIGFSFCLEL